MESKLRRLFDFQKFEGNSDLQQVIDSVHQRYAQRELSMDEMDMVFAAGETNLPVKKDSEKDHVQD